MLDNLVTLDDIKLSLVIDVDDAYYDSMLTMYLLSAVEVLNDYVAGKEENDIKKNVAKVCIIAIVTDLWENRGLTARESLKTNVAVQTLLLSLEH